MAPYGSPPLTNFEAWTVYESLLADYRVDFHYREPPGVERLWREFAVRDTASVKLWMDAYLAAFAHSGGYQMVTTDRAFSQFANLDLVLLSASNP
jgi:predicted nucleic acid-binding protein